MYNKYRSLYISQSILYIHQWDIVSLCALPHCRGSRGGGLMSVELTHKKRLKNSKGGDVEAEEEQEEEQRDHRDTHPDTHANTHTVTLSHRGREKEREGGTSTAVTCTQIQEKDTC
jgi:hypothetical protein